MSNEYWPSCSSAPLEYDQNNVHHTNAVLHATAEHSSSHIATQYSTVFNGRNTPTWLEDQYDPSKLEILI